jgi:uncharacterized RDD family membrane protein YckC
VAVIVDQIILMIITMILAFPFVGMSWMAASMGMGTAAEVAAIYGAMAGVWGLSFLMMLLYFTYFETTTGQTIGKKLVNIKVVKENGKKLTYMDAFVRTLLRIVDSIALYLIGFVVVIATDKKQRIGDMAAGTIVVKA